jgi:hypothetical protein
MVRVLPVTVKMALERRSLELPPALSSTGPGSMQSDAGGRVDGVQLHDLGPAPTPGVGDRQGHSKLTADVHGVARQLQRAVVQGRVAEAVGKGNS